jgi:hypothetical protein
MSSPEYYLRLFDLKKYREIQPIIEDIVRRDVTADRVISLIKAAQQVVQTDDFKKYNSESVVDSDNSLFCEYLKMIERDGILAWFEELDLRNYINTLEPIVLSICCPKYQFSTEDLQGEELSGTSINYYYLIGQSDIYDLELRELLEFNNSIIERFPYDSYDCSEMGVFYNRQYLEELNRAVSEDIDLLSRSDVNLDRYSPQYHASVIADHLKIYDDFNFLLKLANLSEDYTLLRQSYPK